MKTLIYGIFFPLLLIEITTRTFFLPTPEYELPSGKKILFIGKSWMGAAIDVEIVGHELPTYFVENLGRGGATLAMHHMGLQSLVKKNPNALAHSTVIIETSRGLPDLFTQKDSWINDTPGILIPYLKPEHFLSFWRSNTPTEIKYFNTLATGFRFLELIPGLQQKTQKSLENKFNELLYTARSKVLPTIRPVAGVMGDEAAIQHLRSFMLKEAQLTQTKLTEQKPFQNWENLIVHDIVLIVQQGGGEVLFLDIPQSSVSRLENTTAIGKANITQFKSLTAAWGTSWLEATVDTNDSDFPDLSHLSAAKAKILSKRVGAELLKRKQERVAPKISFHAYPLILRGNSV